jgi:hypothetical protein
MARRRRVYYDGKTWHERADGYFANSRTRPGLLHRYVWTKCYGSIPSHHIVHHRFENDRHTTDVERLECITQKQHAERHDRWHDSELRSRAGQATWRDRTPRRLACVDCGSTVSTRGMRNDVRCRKCTAARYARGEVPSRARERRLCVVCGNEFECIRRAATRTCSRPCTSLLAAQVRCDKGV